MYIILFYRNDELNLRTIYGRYSLQIRMECVTRIIFVTYNELNYYLST